VDRIDTLKRIRPRTSGRRNMYDEEGQQRNDVDGEGAGQTTSPALGKYANPTERLWRERQAKLPKRGEA
jgi:hypothetical protein